MTFLREYEGQKVLVAANLSRFSQPCELTISELSGWQPREVFGGVVFPRIGQLPYFLTLGPHGFYWFDLAR